MKYAALKRCCSPVLSTDMASIWSCGAGLPAQAPQFQRAPVMDGTEEMTQPCLICLHVLSLVVWCQSSGTKEMMQPCLIHRHVISLVPPSRYPPSSRVGPCAGWLHRVP